MDILKIALTQYGVAELEGTKHNPKIVKYAEEIGFPGVLDDETAWCSAFINWCAMKAGLEKSGKLNARSWLDVGEDVKAPLPGDVVVFWRVGVNSWKGHVGLFLNYSEDKKFIYTLGGNQNNRVQVSAYASDRLLGFRRLNKAL